MTKIELPHATALLLRSRLLRAAELLEDVADDLKKFGAYTQGRSPRDLRGEAKRLREESSLLRRRPPEHLNEPRPLRPVERTLFAALAAARPQAVATATLAELVWGRQLAGQRSPHAIAAYICRLRKHLVGSGLSIEGLRGAYALKGEPK